MVKSLGFIETRSLIGSIAAADAILKNTDIKIIGKKYLASGEVILILQGDTTSVNLALSIGGEKARELGQLQLSYLLPKPEPELVNVFNDILSTQSHVNSKAKNTPVAPQKTARKDKTKILRIDTENKPAVKDEKRRIDKGSVEESLEITGYPETKEKSPSKISVRKSDEENLHAAVSADRSSSFMQSNETISRLRKEALGLVDDEPVNPEIIEQKKSSEKDTPRKNKKRVKNKTGKIHKSEKAEKDIEQLNVHKLRKLARSMENFPIKGREISRANREELIGCFNRLK